MSDVRIVKFEDLPDFVKQEGNEETTTVKTITEEDGEAVLYTIEFTRTVIPF